jgi:ribosome-interacting GTPase 1
MMPFEDIQVQLVDLPPIGNESTDGWVSGILRYADALIIVVDLSDDPDIQAELLLEQLERWNINIKSKSEIRNPKSETSVGVPKRALIVANKQDLPGTEDNFIWLKEKFGNIYSCIAVSALGKENLCLSFGQRESRTTQKGCF